MPGGGSNTVSMTWITPLLAGMSVWVIWAPPIVAPFFDLRILTLAPSTVATFWLHLEVAASTLAGITW